MKRIFVNETEGRLRAGWRLLLFLALQLSLAVGASELIKRAFGGPPEDETLGNATRGLLVIALTTPAVWAARRLLDRKTWVSLGLRFDRRAVFDLLFGFLLSGFMVALIFVSLDYGGLLEVDHVGWTGNRAPAAGLALWLFGIGLWWAVALMCVFYGVVHMPNPNSTLLSGTLIAVIGFLRIYGWLRTSQLWLTMGMHAGWNFFQGPIFGFHVSGTDINTLVTHTVSGPDWVTGGPFGPEAGVVCLPAILLALLAMTLWSARQPASGRARPSGVNGARDWPVCTMAGRRRGVLASRSRWKRSEEGDPWHASGSS